MNTVSRVARPVITLKMVSRMKAVDATLNRNENK